MLISDLIVSGLSIIIFGAESAADVRKAVLNYRHTWVHFTHLFIKDTKNSYRAEGAIIYHQNLYIILLFNENPDFISSPIWKPGEINIEDIDKYTDEDSDKDPDNGDTYTDKRIPVIYFWNLSKGMKTSRFQLRISFGLLRI